MPKIKIVIKEPNKSGLACFINHPVHRIYVKFDDENIENI